MPSCIEDYVHRIGRTGRANALGTAFTFFTSENARQAKELTQILQEAKQHIPPTLMEMSHTSLPGGKSIVIQIFFC